MQQSLFSTEQIAPIPKTGWTAPASFPNLEAAKTLCIDVETWDPNLKEKGPGWATGDGHLCGIAVGTDDGHRWYFPMRHEIGGGNMDPATVLRWAKREFSRPGQLKVGANLLYDVGWLSTEGVHVEGPFFDVQWAEALLDEHRYRYSLDSIAKDRGTGGKVSDALYRWCSAAYGGKPTARGQGGNIHRAPASLVGPYAEGDVDQPLRIMEQQIQELDEHELTKLCDLEHRLLPMLHAMRARGALIRSDWQKLRDQVQSKIIIPPGVDIWSRDSLAHYCRGKDIAYPMTASKRPVPSFVGPWLEVHLPEIAAARKYDKAAGTFFDGYMGKAVKNKIHCQFHPLRSDAGGTVSGRFSSSDPNLQNIPSRDKELAPLIRGLFIPEEGDLWCKQDYSQIEYRLLAHFARGTGANDVREKYVLDPKTDFHQMVSEMSGLERKPAKILNFGMIYGQGVATTAATMGCTVYEAERFREQYFEKAPFVKHTFDWVARVAGQRGYLRSIGGRLHRFVHWEPRDWGLRDDFKLTTDRDGLEARIRELQAKAREAGTKVPGGGTVRAKTHKALNSLLQGSAADIMKIAMVDVWESGVCDVLGAPVLTVHDELDWSVPDTQEGREAIRESQHIMENCVKLDVPLLVDTEWGSNWANVK